jgi:hypothetical protein
MPHFAALSQCPDVSSWDQPHGSGHHPPEGSPGTLSLVDADDDDLDGADASAPAATLADPQWLVPHRTSAAVPHLLATLRALAVAPDPPPPKS